MNKASSKLLRTGVSFALKLAAASLFPRCEAVLFSGPERYCGENLSVLYVGEGGNREFLLNRFFAHAEAVGCKGRIHPLAANRSCFRADMGADLVAMDLLPPYSLLPPGCDCLRLAPWVKQKLALTTAPESFADRLPRKLRREISRYRKKYEYRYDLTSDEDDFRSFYRELYRPYIQGRFSNESVVVPEDFFLAECRTGLLMRLLCGATPVAGVILQKIGHQLSSVWTGFSPANTGAAGASDVLDFFTIQYAIQQGCRTLDFGPSRPLLDDGVFRYKRKWGTRALLPHVPTGEIRLHPVRMTGAVQSVLAGNLWIIREGGSFHGHLLVEGQTLSPEELDSLARHAGQGIESIHLRSLSGFSREIGMRAAGRRDVRLLAPLGAFQSPPLPESS